MRAALIVVLLIGAGVAAAQPATSPVGFDHVIHNRDLQVSGADSLACTSCHVQRSGLLVGRPDHKGCFGACHGSAPVRPAKNAKLALEPAKLKICTACHAESVLLAPFAKVPVTYPPYTPTDFALEIPHKRHAAVTCSQCHNQPKSGAPHRRCISCHDGSGAAGKGPAMTACNGCQPTR